MYVYICGVHVCVHFCLYLDTRVCSCTCSCTWRHVEWSLQSLSTLFTEVVSLRDMTNLTISLLLRSPISPFLESDLEIGWHAHSAFMWALGTLILIFKHAQKVFHLLSHLLSQAVSASPSTSKTISKKKNFLKVIKGAFLPETSLLIGSTQPEYVPICCYYTLDIFVLFVNI